MRILIVDDDRIIRRILTASLSRIGHEVLEAIDGQSAWELLQREPIRLVISDWVMPRVDGPELIRRIRSSGFPGYTYVILLTSRDSKDDVVGGLQSGADDYLTKPFDPNELQARVGIGERILDLETRLREARDKLEILATHDTLTGLYNRRAIYEHAESEMNRARREGKPVGLALLDIDHFKQVNDHHGHLIGDQALRLVTDTVVAHVRSYDCVGRWGGEEFLVVLPGADSEQACVGAERIRASVEAARLPLPDGGSLQLRVSVGVTSTKVDTGVDIDMLLQQADEALYRAKREGRNRVCLFTEMRNENER